MITERRRVASIVLVALTAFLSPAALPGGAAEAQVSALPLNFGDVAIFATNSVRIDNGARVTAGHVVVNNASSGPTLSPGVELGLGNNAQTPTGYSIVADSIQISNGVVVGGNAFFNTLSNSGTINGTQNTPLALPVFTPLPTFKSAPPGTLDVTVPNGTVQTLAAGNYRDIKVLQNATLRIDQGVTNVRSITLSNGGKLLFLNLTSGPTEVRVAQQMNIGNNFVVGPVDSDPLKAAKIVFYVASATMTTVAVDTGNGGTLFANVYAPNGTLILDNGTNAAGAFLAKNVDVQNGTTVTLESFFVQQAPAITSANSATFAPGLAGQTFLVTTTGFPTNTITRSGVLPSGVTFTDNGNNTATIAGTPAAGTQSASPYAWVITASNGVPPNAMQNFTFNVVCPVITVSGTIPDLIVNQAMATATFTQTGGSGTITWSATGLPNGVSINSGSGDVTGTPTANGSYSVTITATDAGGCTGSKNLTVVVKEAPAITSANSATFAPGVAGQSFTVTTTGFPTNTINRTGTLPSGVMFTDLGNNTATIAGTPAAGTQAGSPYAWVITASNGVPPNAVQNFTFNVVCPVITVSGTIPALSVNTPMATVTFTQAGGNSPITWSATGLPTGVSINSGSGDVTGTPAVTGTFNVTITATDVGACAGSANQTVTVAPTAAADSYSGLVDNTQFVITGGTTATPGTPFVGATGTLIANDQPSGGVSATAGTFATSAGGSVTIASDGTFIYTPKANPGAAATTSDSFTYTVFSNTGGGAAVTSAPATANLTLAGRVWYVLNTAGGGGNGQSQSPFNLLSDGIAASTADDTIYVYQGDGTTTNLATASVLKPGQDFIGQGVALIVNSNTLVPAGGFPLIGNTVTLANNVVVNGIDMTTGTNNGLVGTGVSGLDVTVRHLTSTTGTAVNLNGTGGTVSLTSVSTNGGTNGIFLLNTTGSFTVTGDGTNTTQGGNGTGGTIQNITGADGTSQNNGASPTVGVGVYLKNAANVSLRRMILANASNFALSAESLSGFTMQYMTVNGTNGTTGAQDEGSVRFHDVTGTITVDNCDISGGFEDNIRLDNNTGTLTNFVVTNNHIHDNIAASGNQGILIDIEGTASITTHITGNTFANHRANHVNLSIAGSGTVNAIINNNVATGERVGDLGGNLSIQTAVFTGTLNYDISGNALNGAVSGSAIQVSCGSGSGSCGGRIDNNAIGTAGVPNSGNDQGSGISLNETGTGGHVSLVTNNQVRRYGNTGVAVTAGASGITTGGGMQLTMTGNTITEPENSGGAVPNGINLNIGTNAGNAFTVCADISTNSIAGSGNNVNPGEEDFRLRQRQATTIRLPGYAGANNDNAAVVAFIQGQNTGSETGSATNSVPTGGGFIGGAACTQPTVPN